MNGYKKPSGGMRAFNKRDDKKPYVKPGARPEKKQSPMGSQRQLRVGEAVRHVLAEILSGGTMESPELGKISLTVTQVMMSPDMRYANVLYIPLGGKDNPQIFEFLKAQAYFLQDHIGKSMRMKLTPKLRFTYDDRFEKSSKLDDLLTQVSATLSPAGEEE